LCEPRESKAFRTGAAGPGKDEYGSLRRESVKVPRWALTAAPGHFGGVLSGSF